MEEGNFMFGCAVIDNAHTPLETDTTHDSQLRDSPTRNILCRQNRYITHTAALPHTLTDINKQTNTQPHHTHTHTHTSYHP